MSTKKMLVLFGVLLLAAALLVACGQKATEAPVPTEEAAPVFDQASVPYYTAWAGSGHNAVDSEPFRHWDGDDPAEVPTSCAKCHAAAGYQDFLGADGSEAGKVDAAVPAADAQGITCLACHNPVATNLDSVAFPGFTTNEAGEKVPYVVEGFGDATRCLVCHQGREAKATVDAQIERFAVTDVDAVVAPIKDDQGNDVIFGFRNIHYFAAAATLFGTEVKGGYEYEGKLYDAKHTHVENYDTCIGCHDPHTLEVKVEQCAMCHGDGVTAEGGLKDIREPEASAWDYDGDGNVEEGMYYEIEGLQAALLAEIKAYALDKAGTGITYDPASHPYWFVDADGDGAPDQADGAAVRYSTWTARLLKAAYNFQVSYKDPGAFAHGNKYIVQLIYDSIEDLGGDVSKFARDDAGHFAGNTEAFRHWDGEEYTVPAGCAKCHSAGGMVEFIKEGAVVSKPASNGFLCSTCHDEANWPERYAVTTVPFPSGASVTFSKKDADGKLLPDDSNLCLECHQGRESTVSVNKALAGKDADTVDAAIRFRNVHYFAAGATLFGTDAKGAYEFDGKTYLGKHAHVENGFTCKSCHDVHELEVKTDACATCHGTDDVEAIRYGDPIDYDGDGDTAEGIYGEIVTLQEALYAAMQSYAEAHGGAIEYKATAYPYFFGADGKGYATWTPNLMKAAYNYQYSMKDPGAFAHNGKYVIQFLIDSIEAMGGDIAAYTRP